MKEPISRRTMLQATLGSMMALGCGKTPLEPTNVVLIILDALRAKSLPMYGCPRNTSPFLNQLSKRSFLYTNCYSASSWTIPSVTSILTGLLPSEHNVAKIQISIPPDIPSLPKKLKNVGYHTGLFTNNSVISEGFGLEAHFDQTAFNSYEPEESQKVVDNSLQWINQVKDQPFFAYVHLLPPHIPYSPPEKFVDAMKAQYKIHPPTADYLEPNLKTIDSSLGDMRCEGRFPTSITLPWNSNDPLYYLMRYEANTMFGDSLIANFMSRYNRMNIARPTVFVITSDHGECFGEKGHANHGETINNAILHVPLIIHNDADPTAKIIDTPVSHFDFGSTILALSGSEEIVGDYGWDILSKEVNIPDDRIIMSQEVPTRHPTEKGWAITHKGWRLLYNDFPWYGNDRLLQVQTGEPLPYRNNTIPIEIPPTAIKVPLTLAEGVVLESFGIHSPVVEFDETYSFSGTVRLENQTGELILRSQLNGKESYELGRFKCDKEIVTFNGELKAVAYNATHPQSDMAIEAVWKPSATSEKSTERPQSLIHFLIYRPFKISNDLLLIGMSIKPSIPFAGEDVMLTYRYRYLQHQHQDRLIQFELLDDKNNVVLSQERIVYGKYYKSRFSERTKPILEGHRTYDSFWLSLPSELNAGQYRIRLRLCSIKMLKEDIDTKQYEIVKRFEPFHEQAIQIESKTIMALKALLHANKPITYHQGLHSEAVLKSSPPEQLLPILKRLYYLYPNEGHSQFLMARLTSDPKQREAHLRRCLALTPYHYQALTLASKESWGNKHLHLQSKLTPSKKQSYIFQNIIQLMGFDLTKAPNKEPALYLTLYWQALARMDKPYAGHLIVINNDTGETVESYSIWFLGGNIRPAYSWKIGETVCDSLYIPFETLPNEVFIFFRIYAHWDHVYAGWVEPYTLSIKEYKTNKPVNIAKLGTFNTASLKVNKKDLKVAKRTDISFYQLYNLAEDPDEQNNLVMLQQDKMKDLHYKMITLLEKGRLSLTPGERQLSPAMEERLKALGYTGD